MSTNFNNAADFRKHLETHLQAHSTRTGEAIQRLRRKVAFDRLLARIVAQEPSFFFLKGGYAMELRFAHARATKDMDLTWFKRGSDAKEPIGELILQELQTLARAKDLIDLILLLQLNKGALETFKIALQRVFRARNTHFLPAILPEPPMNWQKPFGAMAAECGISQSLEEGFMKVSKFYGALQA